MFAAGVFAAGRFAPAYVEAASATPPVKSVELVRLVEQVKTGLADAEIAARTRNEMTLFKLDSFDLEVNVVARAEGKNNIKLFTVGSEFSTGSEKVQKVHLRWVADPEQRAGVAGTSSLTEADLAETCGGQNAPCP